MTTDGGHRVPPSSRMEQGMSAKRHCRRCDAHRQTQGYMRHMGMGRQRYSFLGSVIGLLIGLHGAAAMAAGAGSAPSLPPEIFQVRSKASITHGLSPLNTLLPTHTLLLPPSPTPSLACD